MIVMKRLSILKVKKAIKKGQDLFYEGRYVVFHHKRGIYLDLYFLQDLSMAKIEEILSV